MDRRRFLKSAAAALVAPTIVPASALGADGTVAPSNRIVIGQVGFNWIGNSHLHGFLQKPDVQFLGVCEAYRTRLEATQKVVDKYYSDKAPSGTYRGCLPYSDFREMFANPAIDAVVIAVPDHWHAPMANWAAREGKDIYCEKPMSLTIREARAMVETMRRYGRVFQTGSQQRSEFGGNFSRAAELARSGRIGEIKSIYVAVGTPPREFDLKPEPIPEGLDWEMWLGPAPKLPYNNELCPNVRWRWFREFCGGGFNDMGAHHFDIAQWAMGMDESGPVEIVPPTPEYMHCLLSADENLSKRYYQENGPDAGDIERKCLTYKYASGINVYHAGSRDVDIHGTEGRITAGRDYLLSEPESILREPLRAGDVHLDRGKDHRQDWLDCIRTRQRPIADVEIGCRSATVCHLGNIAFQLGRTIHWDPKSENILGDPEAERLLSRAMRSPWRL